MILIVQAKIVPCHHPLYKPALEELYFILFMFFLKLYINPFTFFVVVLCLCSQLNIDTVKV